MHHGIGDTPVTRITDTTENITFSSYYLRALADLRGEGGARDVHPSLGPISFIFMQFLEKIWSNNRLASLSLGLAPHIREILDPPLTWAVKMCFTFKIQLNNN